MNRRWIARPPAWAPRTRPWCLLPLTVALLAGCAAAAPPPAPPERLTPTACEKRALLIGQAPDLAGVGAVADGMWWGLLAPEACPNAGGRLDRRAIEQ